MAFGGGHALRLETDFGIVQHGEPWKQREGLEHHRHLTGGPPYRLAVDCDDSGGRRHQPGDDAQQRRFAAAGAAEQPHDFIVPEREIDIVENKHVSLALPIDVAQAFHLNQRSKG